MGDNFVANVFSAGAAIVAVVVSFYAVRISRRSVITSVVSTYRVEWVDRVRELIYSFLIEYRGQCRKEELINIYTHVLLFLYPNHETYAEVVESMKQCINGDYCEDNYWDLVTKGQLVLRGPWLRLKREAGITSKREPKFVADLIKEELSIRTLAYENPKWWADLRKK